ncbi:MAG: PadR family transcriptional regulator [Calditrichaeota bacterium]|nr:PadR family transcriptional regulator [Calditrichota bacterium]
MSLKHAILGFLSFQSFTGYDLKQAFDNSVAHFWPADQSQIYRTLKQLHQEGLISQEVIPREDRLDVKIYEITDTGRGELHQWLSTPLPLTDTRDPFLIQLYFAFMLEDVQAIRLLKAEMEQVDQLMQVYESVYQVATGREHTPEEKRPLFYTMLTLEFGVRANTWYRHWLQEVVERIEAGEMDVLSPEALFAPVRKEEKS